MNWSNLGHTRGLEVLFMAKKTKRKAGKDIIGKIDEQKSDQKTPKIYKIDDLISGLPKHQLNRRKDGFVKISNGGVYLREVSYGIQVLENIAGSPRKVIGRVETEKDLKTWVTTIRKNIKDFIPPEKRTGSKRELSPTDRIPIEITVKTRTRMKSVMKDKETYDQLINRALSSMVK